MQASFYFGYMLMVCYGERRTLPVTPHAGYPLKKATPHTTGGRT